MRVVSRRRAMCYGISSSHYNFFAVIETRTIFTLQEKCDSLYMRCSKSLGLSMGDLPHEEYILCTEELHLLKRDAPQVYETYQEVLCHFHICVQATGWRSGEVKQMSWANYHFRDLREKLDLVSRLAASTDTEITKDFRISNSYTTVSNEDTFKPDTVCDSFHHQAKIPISDRALLARFKMLWLKRCVMPTTS